MVNSNSTISAQHKFPPKKRRRASPVHGDTVIAASRPDGGGMQLRSEGRILAAVTLPVGLVTVGINGEFLIKGEQKKQGQLEKAITIGGGFKDFLCSTLPGEDSHFDVFFRWVETTN